MIVLLILGVAFMPNYFIKTFYVRRIFQLIMQAKASPSSRGKV